MFNFKIKGKFKSEDELINGKQLPDGAIQFKEGDSLQDAFIKGLLIGLPLFVVMIVSMIFRLRNVNYNLEMNIQTGITFATMIIILGILPYVHEFIHGIFYPLSAEKAIWKLQEQGAYFVYCDETVSKERFIVLSIAPAIILGIIPFVGVLIFAESISAACIIATWIVSLIMTVMAIGDFANIYNAIKQVPKGAKVFNYGMHTYWMR